MTGYKTAGSYLAELRANDPRIESRLSRLRDAQVKALIDGLDCCVTQTAVETDFTVFRLAIETVVDLIDHSNNYPSIISEISQFQDPSRRAVIKRILVDEEKCEEHDSDSIILICWIQEYINAEDWILGLS